VESEEKPEDRKSEKQNRIQKPDEAKAASVTPEDKKPNGQMTLDL
jgi:hypothetical protein